MKKLFLIFAIGIMSLTLNLKANQIDYETIQKIEEYMSNEKGWHPLNYAIEMDDYKTALIICEYSEKVNTVDDGFNPINRIFHRTCRKINLSTPIKNRPKLSEEALELVWAILDKGINVNYVPLNCGLPPSGNSSSSFIYICFLGLEDLFYEFIHRRVDINQRKGSPLATAIRAGHMNIVQSLIEEGANANWWALHQAVSSKNFEAINILLQAGADINEIDLLMSAIFHHKKIGHYLDGLPMLRFLLEMGANPNAIAMGKKDPILKVVLTMPADTVEQQNYKTDVINTLIEYGAVLY
ncbi:ankyrin repeat domain-containing protein [Waddlia chondrophila]|uniref:Uncharacterized protein n=1 Tax=Waddlia chondrophila (strain ATCC VR-1470 / WSU 86-1044) TaxID=716544 RepID=D6YX13_WADCW|nr:ankyrin repeat domain-containing protein [Waddlia chondrophila]ADI39319.1 hypothetical protein wcw_p0008 [Waddlia chondrophila WSU 86-1044]